LPDRFDFGAEHREMRLRRYDLGRAAIRIWRNIM